ncbi:hypothetical protein AVEN_260857-1 [Araneus ventricosus]|uniref:Uncharacterized protein n=1 Tax=Araneus ventricosus TaxID=182803 RepID=A0A4Y2GRJ3_ARAVE|nr:hypothetical protein AVEN_260857-1 [Araneus ventricosus]
MEFCTASTTLSQVPCHCLHPVAPLCCDFANTATTSIATAAQILALKPPQCSVPSTGNYKLLWLTSTITSTATGLPVHPGRLDCGQALSSATDSYEVSSWLVEPELNSPSLS